MSQFNEWLATTAMGSALKVFVGVFLTLALAAWTQGGEISFEAWQTWVIGALGVSAPIVINWLNPKDSRYGKVDS
jgi:hypothetical protein